MITQVYCDSGDEDYNEDMTVGCYINWDISRVKHPKAMKSSDSVHLLDCNGVKHFTASFDPSPPGLAHPA